MLFTLAQVIGARRVLRGDDGGGLARRIALLNCVCLTNYVQNLRDIAQLFAGAGVGVAPRRRSSHNRRAWLQSQRILMRFVGKLFRCSCHKICDNYC